MTHTNCSGFCRFDDSTDHRFEPIPREHWDSDWMVGVSLQNCRSRAEEKVELYIEPELMIRFERGIFYGRIPYTEMTADLTREEMCEWLIRDRDRQRERDSDPDLDYVQMAAYVCGKSLGSFDRDSPEFAVWRAAVDQRQAALA